MNKELVALIKHHISYFKEKDKILREHFNEEKNKGASHEVLVKSVEAVKENVSKYENACNDLRVYKEKEEELTKASGAQMLAKDEEDFKQKVEEFERVANEYLKFEKQLADKYNFDLGHDNDKNSELEEDEDEVVAVTAPKGNKGKKIIAALIAAGIIFGAGVHVSNIMNKTEVAQVQDEEDKEETKNENLKAGEYGTFKDVSEKEQVEARAKYIYDEYYSKFIGDLSTSEQKEASVENIANTIRVLNGELPLDVDGNAYFDANLVDEYGQLFVKVVCDLPSSPELDRVYHVPSHLFAVDGSESSEFLKPYDEDYSNIAKGRNAGDNVKTEEAIRSLATKMWRQWSLQGMYGEVSPYDLNPKDRTMVFLGSMAKFGQYPFEYSLNNKTATCIDACLDYNNPSVIKKLSASEIFVGVTSGKWDTVIAKAAGIEVDAEPDSIVFQKDLEDTLEFKYRELKQLTIK
ncbi:MAG: hypothetical protein GX758_02945 [Tenericutes bacterium]|nr:hypothetical protein [Mycoplasmatota bacterium]